jgi:hypothetical protein
MPVKNEKPAKTASRSAVTGRQMGRAAQRSENKNSDGAESFVAAVEADNIHPATTLARVTRQVGGARVELQLYTGETGIYTIAGRIAFRGRAANKTDRNACMCVGDFVVVDGAQVAAVLSDDQAKRVEAGLLLSCVAAARAAEQATPEVQVLQRKTAADALLAHRDFYPPEEVGGFDFEEVDVEAV